MSIGDAIEFLEEDTTRDLAELAARIDVIESRMKSRSSDEPDGDPPGGRSDAHATTDNLANESEDVVFRRMLTALSDSKFTWRTVERLAILAGVTEKEAHDILAKGREIRLGKAKSGKIIARLADR